MSEGGTVHRADISHQPNTKLNKMHSGGGASSVVSVAPATPMVKHMIGVAAIVLEGREKIEYYLATTNSVASSSSSSNKAKDPASSLAMRGHSGSGTSSLLYATTATLDPVAAMSTTATTTSNWARAQNNRLAHIYRLKNRLLVEQQHQQQHQRSSPVPDFDPVAMAMGDEEAAAVAAFGSGGIFEPLQHLTARTCRMTTPRSFMNLHMDKRHISSSSSSSTSSTGGGSVMASGGSASGYLPNATTIPSAAAVVVGRRNSRSSPVPVFMSAATTHCDDFLRTIGLLKAPGGAPTVGGGASGAAMKKMLPVDDDESHYCNEVLNGECFRWQQFLRKIETLLCRGSSICIEVSLGPEAHPLLLEQWVIQRVDRPSQPSMTIQSLCSAIRSQLHFSQISAWSDLLEQQYTDYGFYQEHILNNPRITMNRATNRPKLDLIYRVKCASQKSTFERAPVVHNFPNVIQDAYTAIAVSLRSLPRLERIPRLSVENKKSEMEVTVPESEILPNPVKVCCQEKGKHRCLTLDDMVNEEQQRKQHQVVHLSETTAAAGGSSASSTSGVSSQNNNHLGHGMAMPGCSNGSCVVSPPMPQSHREKQLMKYKKRLQKRDKGKVRNATETNETRNTVLVGLTNSKNLGGGGGEKIQNVPASINDLCLPLYTDLEVASASSNRSTPMYSEKEHPAVISQDVGTQTDLHMAIDDEIVEMEVDNSAVTDEPEQDVPMAMCSDMQRSSVSCGQCNKQMHLICWHCCDNNNSSNSKRFQKLCEKYRTAMAKQRGGGGGAGGASGGHSSRVFYKLPKNRSLMVRKLCGVGGIAKDKRLLQTPANTMTTTSISMSSEEGEAGSGCSGGTSLESDDEAGSGGGKGWIINQKDSDRMLADHGKDNNNVSNMANRNVAAAAKGVSLPKEATTNICDTNQGQGARNQVKDDDDDCNLCAQKKMKTNKRQASYAGDVPEELRYLTPTNEPSRCAGVRQRESMETKVVVINQDEKPEFSDGPMGKATNMKLLKQDHEPRTLIHTDLESSTLTGLKTLNTSSPTSHCIKNLTSIFTSASDALEKPPTPQAVLKRLNLLPHGSSDVFNFDLKTSPGTDDGGEGAMGKGRDNCFEKLKFATGGVKKSLSTPSAFPDGSTLEFSGGSGGAGVNKTSPTPNSLSPRFLKSASVYNKKRRSRHLSDRSSERSSVCSDELSLSDDETLLLTPNGSNLLLSSSMSPLLLSPVMPGRAILGPDGKPTGRTSGPGGLFRSMFGQRPLLGSIEESLLQKRLTPKFLVSGFRVLLGASGGFCPKQLTIPAKTFFYELSGQSQTTPYMSEVRLPRKGYTIPRSGTVQVTLLNPLGTFVHMFVVPYDFREMPTMSTTFIRQRSLMFDDTISSTTGKMVAQLSTEEQMKLLRYVIHLRFQTTRSGRLVLHTDIRMLISRRTDHDTAAAHAKGALESPNELKTITIMPENPRFSDRIDKV